jgi:hypothetical protein
LKRNQKNVVLREVKATNFFWGALIVYPIIGSIKLDTILFTK